MTTLPPGEVRVRRPMAHEALMLELQGDARFPTYRDILLFAAALGVKVGRRTPFTETFGDPIRYEVMLGRAYADTLISMISANELADDAEIMNTTRLQERVTVFEEYANGGLDFIQETVNMRRQPAAEVVLSMVADEFSEDGGAKPLSIEELLKGVST